MGDESVWQTQQFPLTFYKEGEADTCVFWDLNYYPIPIGVHPAWIYKRIKDAISDQGIVGDVSIHGYVDVSEREYWDAGFQVEVFPQSEGGKHTRHCSMLADMSIWAFNHPTPSNVIILAQVTDDLLDQLFRSYCSRIYGYLFSRQLRVPARSDPTFLTCIFDQQREREKEE